MTKIEKMTLVCENTENIKELAKEVLELVEKFKTEVEAVIGEVVISVKYGEKMTEEDFENIYNEKLAEIQKAAENPIIKNGSRLD